MVPLKLKQVTFRITEEQYQALEEIADKEDRVVSSVIRLMILKLLSGEISIETKVIDRVYENGPPV